MGSSDTATTPKTGTATQPSHVPSELFGRCVEYCDWGDLAKLACVQSSWSNIVKDTANTSSQSKWELAQALLEGHCGLQPNPAKAVTLLQELAQIPIDDTTGNPIIDDDVDNKDTVDATNTDTTSTTCYGPAIRQLANCYLDGNGVDQNPKCALAWLEASFVVGGDADAAHEVALIQEYGRHGIEVDVVAAAKWFEKAAEAGHVESMTELGLCYELGCGVEQSDEQSLDWYTKAANLGHATAKFSVGEAFEEARGVPQSDQEACLWYHRAALAGDADSKKALRRLYDIARIVVPGVGDILRE
jgi:Sel1 repeat